MPRLKPPFPVRMSTRFLLSAVSAVVLGGGNASADPPAPAGAPASAAAATPKRVWLSDLPERNVKVGTGTLGKNGNAGYKPGVFTTHGLSCDHGLGAQADSHVEYVLGKNYRMFRATAAMADTSTDGLRPVEFRVLGDDKLLWQSYGMRGHPNAQPCLLDITGVGVLALEARFRPETAGDTGRADSVWLDPYVAADPPSAMALALCDPQRFLNIEKAGDFDQRLRDSFAKDDFAQLETVAKSLREKDIFYAGQSMRERFYATLSQPVTTNADGQKKLMAGLQHWRKAQPLSPVPSILLGMAWRDLAVLIRDGRFVLKTNPPIKFEDCITRAYGALGGAELADANEPDIYPAMISVCMAKGRPREEAFNLLERGIRLAPRSYSLYGSMASYLLRNGKPGDIQQFAADMRKRLGGNLGDEVYFRIACEEAESLADNFFAQGGFRYEDLIPGMRVMMTDYPESYRYFNNACHMACLADDKVPAALLLDRVDQATFWNPTWVGYGHVERWRRAIEPHSYYREDFTTFWTYKGWVRGVAFLKEKNRLLDAGYDAEFDLLDLTTLETVDRFFANRPILKLAIDAARSQVIVATGVPAATDWEATVYDLQGDHAARILKGHSSGLSGVAVSPDGSLYGTAARDNTAKIWKRGDLEKPLTLKHPEWVYDIAFSPDGKTVATSSYKGGLWLWNAETGEPSGDPLSSVQNGPWECRLAFVPNGKALITASTYDGTIRRWDLETRKFQEAKPEGDAPFGLGVSPDGKWIAIGRNGGRVDVLLVESLALVHSFHGHHAAVLALDFSPDSKTLVSGSDDGTIKLWSIAKLLTERPSKDN